MCIRDRPQGASQALIMTSAQVLMMDDVDPARAGSAGGVAQTTQRVGTSIGMAVVLGAFYAAGPGDGTATASAEPFAHALVVALGVVAVSWTIVFVSSGLDLLRRHRACTGRPGTDV